MQALVVHPALNQFPTKLCELDLSMLHGASYSLGATLTK